MTVTDIATIDLGKLTAKDPFELERLIQAAQSPGFFYLDFQNDNATKVVKEQGPELFTVTDRYFDLPAEVKMKDFRTDQPASSDRGYKSCESDETFEMSYDEMQQGKLRLPTPLSEKESVFNEFHSHCHLAAKTLLTRLAEALSLPLQEYHREGEPTETGLKLIAEPSLDKASDVQENKHTDSGTFTMLFYNEWSLHIQLPGGGNWTFVPPPSPGVALVHVANSLQRMTQSQLHSPLHRVTQPADGAAKRYFLSYFLRPEADWASREIAGY
ncbi:Clavaminate synthase-like protein [Aspergillus avenaceus]|uniref:Clavaminate synthase-like protein n=1 Tax=Aspergillus avenaceus TaxID=36643 RepID=A0A5N6U5K1_ASPAV|nr:Clavaminate synthase-like protein [Aspergillus avenaceus]